MEKYITDDELDQIWADNFDLDDVTEEDTKIIYREFLCDTKNRLKATLTDEQKKIFAFLEYAHRILCFLAKDSVDCNQNRIDVTPKFFKSLISLSTSSSFPFSYRTCIS